jgi:acyl carrier protein
MSQKRAGMNEYTFVNYLATFGFDADIARTTYQYLQERQNVSFPIDAHDQLDEDLGLDSTDINQSVRELLEATGREYRPGMLHSPLITVEDLVRYLQSCPRKGDVAA